MANKIILKDKFGIPREYDTPDTVTLTGNDESLIEYAKDAINTDDANATAADILKDKTAYVGGEKLTGTKEFLTQEKTATENGEVTPDEGYDGLSKVTVDVDGGLPEEDAVVDLDMEDGDQEILPAEGYTLSKVTVTKPDTLIPENIKDGVTIGGVVGELTGGGPEAVLGSLIVKNINKTYVPTKLEFGAWLKFRDDISDEDLADIDIDATDIVLDNNGTSAKIEILRPWEEPFSDVRNIRVTERRYMGKIQDYDVNFYTQEGIPEEFLTWDDFKFVATTYEYLTSAAIAHLMATNVLAIDSVPGWYTMVSIDSDTDPRYIPSITPMVIISSDSMANDYTLNTISSLFDICDAWDEIDVNITNSEVINTSVQFRDDIDISNYTLNDLGAMGFGVSYKDMFEYMADPVNVPLPFVYASSIIHGIDITESTDCRFFITYPLYDNVTPDTVIGPDWMIHGVLFDGVSIVEYTYSISRPPGQRWHIDGEIAGAGPTVSFNNLYCPLGDEIISTLFKLPSIGKDEVETVVELDMTEMNGAQIVTPISGETFSKVTIQKPDTLTPENIKKDINIGGIIGTLAGGGGGGESEQIPLEVTANGVYDASRIVYGDMALRPDVDKSLLAELLERAVGYLGE